MEDAEVVERLGLLAWQCRASHPSESQLLEAMKDRLIRKEWARQDAERATRLVQGAAAEVFGAGSAEVRRVH